MKIPNPIELLGGAAHSAKPKLDLEAYRVRLEALTAPRLRQLAEQRGVPNLHSRLGKGDYVNRLIAHAKSTGSTGE